MDGPMRRSLASVRELARPNGYGMGAGTPSAPTVAVLATTPSGAAAVEELVDATLFDSGLESERDTHPDGLILRFAIRPVRVLRDFLPSLAASAAGGPATRVALHSGLVDVPLRIAAAPAVRDALDREPRA